MNYSSGSGVVLEAPVLPNSEEELVGPPQTAVPTKRGERISSLDVLRGFSLLGILAVNIENFGGPESLQEGNHSLVRGGRTCAIST
jgi:hypothetical protein